MPAAGSPRKLDRDPLTGVLSRAVTHAPNERPDPVLATTTVQLTSPDALRAALEKAGSSTRLLAKAADCSPSRIGQLIQGKDTGVSVGTAVAIASALQLEVRDLFEFPDGDALIRLGLIRDV